MTPRAHGPDDSTGLDRASHEILQAVLAGDQDALAELLARCWDSVVNYAASITGGIDPAEDVAQETFCRIWSNRDVWRSRGEATLGLVYRIARNLALNHQRAGARRERHLALYRDSHQRPPDIQPPWPATFELRAAVETAIASLPPRRREVFTLARFHGLTYAEIAETMGVSQQTVANQMGAALATLRQSLDRFMDLSTRDDDVDMLGLE